MARTDDKTRTRRGGEAPDPGQLVADWRRCVDGRQTNFWKRQQLNWEARYCVWANQTSDGKKWSSGKYKAFPWDGAADTRVSLVDRYVREDAAMLMSMWTDVRLLVRPNDPSRDAAWANTMTSLLRWLIYEEMAETEDEAELLANYLLERGCAAMGIWWKRQETVTRETIELRQLAAAAEVAAERLRAGEQGDALQFQAMLPQMIADPTREDQAVALVRAVAGEQSGLTEARLRRMVRELRESGLTRFPRRVVSENRPCVRALAWNEDIWTPPEVVDLQNSRQIFVRELLSEADLAARARELDWDQDYLDQVIETQKGRTTELTSIRRDTGKWNTLGLPQDDELYEWLTVYERLLDEDEVPGIWVTAFSPGLGKDEGVASCELLDYAHGQYPFVAFARERRSRLIEDARGYGEIASTWQQHIKRQWDTRLDRADIATLPPSHHPPGEEPEAWGPGISIPTLTPDRFGYFEQPKYDAGSKEIEDTVREFADAYFGRVREGGANQVEAMALKRELVRKWFSGWKRVHTQILQLCQQYLPDEVYFRVVGDAQGRGIRATREEIQGPFSVTLKFNPQDLDAELVKQKLELIEKALQLDATAIVDRTEAVKVVFELIDPGYAERLLRPAEGAALSEIKDEQDTLAKLLLGIQVDVQGNEAFALRKQVLEQMIQANPVAQAIIRSTPAVAENVKRRLEQLDFNIQQKLVNPEIGRRLGTKPANVG